MEKKNRRWVLFLVSLLIVCGAIVFLLRGCDREFDTSISEMDGEEQKEETKLEKESGMVSPISDSLEVIDSLKDFIIAEEDIDVVEGVDKDVVKGEIVGAEEGTDEFEDVQLEAELKRQEQLRKKAEEERRRREEVEEVERIRLEEEARLAAEEAEKKRQEAAELERIQNEGVLSGEFSIAYNKKVRFSRGNLQYQASTDTWRFATNQWDYEGYRNEEIDPDNVGWIDLFGWGTSGYNKKFPFMISRYSSDYISGERNISKGKYDWGVYNAISNGGGKENMWRVLTNNEWRHLFCKRKNASKLFTFGTVAGVKGLILLPDDWEKPLGVRLALSIENGMKYVGDDEYINDVAKTSMFDHNILSINNWRILEENGAVFFPAAGGRDYANVFEVQLCGFYWSGTHIGEFEAYMVGFSSGNFVASDYELRASGFSVRLVRDVKDVVE